VKVGDLVRQISTGRIGIVEEVDEDYYGARQAFKIYRELPRGKCIRGNMVDGFGPTKDGIRDRVTVCWTDGLPDALDSKDLEVISEHYSK